MLNDFTDRSHYCDCYIDINTDPTKKIKYVKFDYTCPIYFGFTVWLLVDGKRSDPRNFTECPCKWRLNRKVYKIKLASNINLQPECMHVEVVYEEPPQEWIPLASGESYPLPSKPTNISKITFEAKTDVGTTSQLCLFIEGSIITCDEIGKTPKFENWDIGFTVPVNLITLTNTGSSTIYISNLTLEE